MSYPIYSRADWAVRAPSFGALRLPVRKVFAHHTAGPYMPGFDVGAMRAAEESEIGRGGYVALAYHELFPGDGSQVESRPVSCMGGATINNNSTSIAVCLPGNYATPDALVSWAQAGSVQDWLAGKVFQGVLTSDFELLPHKAVFATACPGAFEEHLAAIRAGVAGVPAPSVPAPSPPSPPAADAHAFLEHLAEAVTATRRFLAMGLVVSRGSHNDAAWTVQLAVHVWTPRLLVVDSDFGLATEKGVRGYQAAHGLTADGIVGRKTYGVMYP